MKNIKEALKLIKEYDELNEKVFNDYGGYNSILCQKMDKIAQKFIVLTEMTIEDFKKQFCLN